MMRLLARLTPACALAALACAVAQPASAQGGWPSGTVRIVVPFPPGGAADGLPRVLSEPLAKMWGQPVIIENKPGAGGNVGAEAVSRAAPDGYTLLSAPTPVFAINQALYKKLSFDPAAFRPIVLLGQTPSAISVHPKLGVKSVKELIETAKSTPGITYGSQGMGTTSHLTTAMFEWKAGIKLNHVPYRGSGPVMTDLIGGHIQLTFDNLASALGHHRAGTIVTLAVCSAQRSPFIPELPTMIEAGIPDFISVAWFAVAAPAGTPDAVIERVNKDVNALLRQDEIRQKFAAQGAEPLGGTPQELATFAAAERKRWADVVKTANIPQVE